VGDIRFRKVKLKGKPNFITNVLYSAIVLFKIVRLSETCNQLKFSNLIDIWDGATEALSVNLLLHKEEQKEQGNNYLKYVTEGKILNLEIRDRNPTKHGDLVWQHRK
jgi:hypothetical protein